MEKAYEELVYMAKGYKMVNYFEVSITALFLYDYLLNLGDELRFIWRRPGWGMGKALYVLARFIPFAIIPITLSDQLPFPVSENSCLPLFFASTATQAFAITVSQCLFSLRNYAMWDGKRLPKYISISSLVSSLIIVIVLLGIYLPSVHFGPSPIPAISTCFKTAGNSTGISGTFIVVILNEAILLASIMIRLRQQMEKAPNQLLGTLMRDGVLYCCVIFFLSFINAVVEFTAPIAYLEVIEMFQSILQTMLATNMQLHLCRVHEFTAMSKGVDISNVTVMQFSDRGESSAGMVSQPDDDDTVVMIGQQNNATMQTFTPYRHLRDEIQLMELGKSA